MGLIESLLVIFSIIFVGIACEKIKLFDAHQIVHPIIAFYVGCKLFSLNGYWLNALIIASYAPTAFFVYIIAKQFSTDQHLIKMTVAISSMVSLISLVLIACKIGSGKI